MKSWIIGLAILAFALGVVVIIFAHECKVVSDKNDKLVLACEAFERQARRLEETIGFNKLDLADMKKELDARPVKIETQFIYVLNGLKVAGREVK